MKAILIVVFCFILISFAKKEIPDSYVNKVSQYFDSYTSSDSKVAQIFATKEEGKSVGLRATKEIKTGDKIACFSTENQINQDRIEREGNKNNFPFDKDTNLAIWLLIEKDKGVYSKYSDWISILPDLKELEEYLPLSWSEKKLKRLMLQTNNYQEYLFKRKKYQDSLGLISELKDKIFKQKKISDNDIKWAYLNAISRSFDDSFIPGLDFLRGSSKMENLTSVSKDRKKICIIASKDYVPNEEIFLPLFNEKTNLDLWVNKGYLIENNPKTGFSFIWSTQSVDVLKSQIIEKIYPTKKSFFISKYFNDIPINLWKIFRINFMSEADFSNEEALKRVVDCNELFLESGIPDFKKCGVNIQHEILTVSNLKNYFHDRYMSISGVDLKEEDLSSLSLQEKNAFWMSKIEMETFKHFYTKLLAYFVRLQN